MEGDDIVITEGDDTNIPCTAGGSPLPTITWQQANGNALSNRLSMSNPVSNATTVTVSLVITGVSREDSGTYRCNASNIVGSDNKTVNLFVQCKF